MPPKPSPGKPVITVKKQYANGSVHTMKTTPTQLKRLVNKNNTKKKK